jgi:mRNA interferase MazF
LALPKEKKSGNGGKFRAPSQGDLIWLDFSPHAGHEQAGRRPALVVSPSYYNRKSGLALVCPITNKAKAYPFEVALPAGLELSGAVLCDHLKSADWRARRAEIVAAAPPDLLADVLAKIAVLLQPEDRATTKG